MLAAIPNHFNQSQHRFLFQDHYLHLGIFPMDSWRENRMDPFDSSLKSSGFIDSAYGYVNKDHIAIP